MNGYTLVCDVQGLFYGDYDPNVLHKNIAHAII